METTSIGPALVLTLLAGLATAIGSAIAFFAPRADTRFLAIALGFSAGVMIYVSFVELLPSGVAALEDISSTAEATAVVALFVGMLLAASIDRLVPASCNPHEMRCSGTSGGSDRAHSGPPGADQMMRTGLLTAAAITLHNLPEGLATLLISMQDIHLGIPVAPAGLIDGAVTP
jgi:ZIP family zinc transporter